MTLDTRSDRLHCMRKIEDKVQRSVFDQEPYVKFLPQILHPPVLDWSKARQCDPESARRIVIPAFGRDPIAFEGWLRFTILATHSVLHCQGIEEWAVDVVTGSCPSQHVDLPAEVLFGELVDPSLSQLTAFGVRISQVDGLDSPSKVYSYYKDSAAEVVLRLDADAGLLPGALAAPCFNFSSALGHSGLNLRHTGRSGFAQLIAPHGRMSQWSVTHNRSANDWLKVVVSAGRRVLGVETGLAEARSRMENVPWLSEGFSYLRGEHIPAFVALRDELVGREIVPAWDEETVKLALVGLCTLSVECCRVQVLEHTDYGRSTPDTAVVNFRNLRSLAGHARQVLDGVDASTEAFSYLQEFAEDVHQRAIPQTTI